MTEFCAEHQRLARPEKEFREIGRLTLLDEFLRSLAKKGGKILEKPYFYEILTF
jgi:hypothetical protein